MAKLVIDLKKRNEMWVKRYLYEKLGDVGRHERHSSVRRSKVKSLFKYANKFHNN